MSLFDRFWKKQTPETRMSLPPQAQDTDDSDDLDEIEEMMRAAKAGPERPLLYVFEHASLPEAVFQNHPELARELAEPRATMPLLHFRSKAYVRCQQLGMLTYNESEEEADGLDTELDEMDTLFRGLAVHPYKRDGYTVHVVTMPAPLYSPEVYFAAIVYKDSEPKGNFGSSSTRYLTLEKSESPLPMLCEWTREGTHLNFGQGPAPDISAFVEAVFARILSR